MTCNTCPPDMGHNRPDECDCGKRIGINARDHANGCNYEWQNGQPLVETYATSKGGAA